MARKPPTIRDAALKLLSRREHSREELRRKLAEKCGREAGGEIDSELGRLEELGLLSDLRFARAYAREVCGKFAARRVRAELKKRGVGDHEIQSALDDAGIGGENSAESELARARELIARRRRADAEDPDSIARENAKLMRWLATRGFSFDIARRAAAMEDAED